MKRHHNIEAFKAKCHGYCCDFFKSRSPASVHSHELGINLKALTIQRGTTDVFCFQSGLAIFQSSFNQARHHPAFALAVPILFDHLDALILLEPLQFLPEQGTRLIQDAPQITTQYNPPPLPCHHVVTHRQQERCCGDQERGLP